jgi:hypothetical protein
MTTRGVRRAAALLRWTIGLVLVATGAGKLLDIRGFAEILRSYEILPAGSLLPLAVAVPMAELALAFWLFSGRRLVGAGAASAGMHLAYAAWSAAALMRGLSLSNCGCFGVFLARPLTGQTVAEDLVMVALSVALAVCARRLRGSE